MKIVFAGTPEVAIPALDALLRTSHQVVGVISREDAPLGRKRVLTPSPVAQYATKRGIPVIKANRLDAVVTASVAALGADLGVVVAYGGLLKQELLETPKLGWINLHFSHLPRWRGAAPVQRALINEEQQLGLSVFRLVEALDAGDVVTRGEETVPVGTTAGEALAQLALTGGQLLVSAVTALENDPHAGVPQAGEPTYAHKLTREDGKLSAGQSSPSLIAHWAGVTPEPGAYFEVDGQPLKIHDMRLADGLVAEVGEPGHVTMINKRVMMCTNSGHVELLTVQPAGKARMAAADWLRGKSGEAILT